MKLRNIQNSCEYLFILPRIEPDTLSLSDDATTNWAIFRCLDQFWTHTRYQILSITGDLKNINKWELYRLKCAPNMTINFRDYRVYVPV